MRKEPFINWISLLAIVLLIYGCNDMKIKGIENNITFEQLDCLSIDTSVTLRAFNYYFDYDEGASYIVAISLKDGFIDKANYLKMEDFSLVQSIILSELRFKKNEVSTQDFVPLKNELYILDQRMYKIENGDSKEFISKNLIYHMIQYDDGISKSDTVFRLLDSDSEPYNLVATVGMPLEFQDNMYFNKSFFLSNALKPNIENYWQQYYNTPNELYIDLSRNTTYQLNATFPNYYSQYDYDDYHPARCINSRGQFVYSFAVEHNLKVYDRNFNEVKGNYPAKSEYITQFKTISDEPYNNSYYDDYYLLEPRYTRMIYDRFSELHYRICVHRMEEKKSEFEKNTIKDKQ